MPGSQPLVFTIILNWNGLADTRECLESLQRIDYSNNRIVVVENGSEPGEAAAIQEQFGNAIHLIESASNLGFAGGANLGVRYALENGADFVLLLNNDTVVDPGFLTALLQAAESRDDLAACSPKTYFYEHPDVLYSTGGTVNLWTASARQAGRGQPDGGEFDQPAVRDYADGVCMLVPRLALETVGLLDEDYFAYWEETDWCVRARAKGLRCYYVPNSKIWHKAARAQAPTSRYYFLFRRNALMFVRKRGTPLHLATALLTHIFFFAPRYFLTHPGKIGRAPAELKALLSFASNQQPRRPLL